MNPVAFSIATLSGTVAFGFVLGVVVPLISAGSEASKAVATDDEAAEPARLRELLADLLLIILDSLPIFTLFRAAKDFRELPSTARAMRAKWACDRSVRQCSWMAAVSIAVFVPSFSILMMTWQ